MYTDKDFKTKKALKEAIKSGQKIGVYQPNDMFNTKIPENGVVCIEGPHYPKPHTYYCTVTLENGYIVKVK